MIHADWFLTSLYGHIPRLGSVLMTYEPDPVSTVDIHSLNTALGEFFPARAEQTLHYKIELVDEVDGRITGVLRSSSAATMTAVIDSIPPVGTIFTLENDVIFFDADANEIVTLVSGSTGAVLDHQGLAISVQSITLDSGGFFTVSYTCHVSDPELALSSPGSEAIVRHSVACVGDQTELATDQIFTVVGNDSVSEVRGRTGPASSGVVIACVLLTELRHLQAHLMIRLPSRI